MPEYLGEHYVSVAAELYFPNVQTCCAVVVTTTLNNNLGGYHLTYFSGKRELDRALLYLRDAMGGNVDGVYVIGNVLDRANIAQEGLAYAAPLKASLRSGLGYLFDIKYYDIGVNNPGVAVHAWRDAHTNGLRLAVATNGNWANAGMVAAGMATMRINEAMAPAMDGNSARRLHIMRPPGGQVMSCNVLAENAIVPFTMATF